jgi:outer membrane protein OmpA-like peptidoglycan-associated protein
LAGAGLALGLAACSATPSDRSYNPLDWWHGLEGGPIAETRPPPPNADAPYPTLGAVPARPANNDAAGRGRVASALLADRGSAEYGASLVPLPKPGQAGRPMPAPPPPDAETPSASLQAASAPPPPPAAAAPAKAPPSTVAAAPANPAASAAPAATAEAAAMPSIPDQPPPPPRLPGVATATAPNPPPKPPPAPPPPVPPITGGPLAIAFPAGSALLSHEADQALRQFAQHRGPHAIVVTGYGDATSDETDAQAAALPRALDRADAVAASLRQAGVPSGAIRIAADAIGRGAIVRLTD